MKVTPEASGRNPSLVDALRLLPNIRPVYERNRLGEAKHEAAHSPDRTASFNGVWVTQSELEELFLDGEGGGPRMSRQGAALLLQLFEQGAFDFFECRAVAGGLELLRQYCEGKATLLGSTFWRKVRRPRPRAATKPPRQSAAPAMEVPIARPSAWGKITVHVLA